MDGAARPPDHGDRRLLTLAIGVLAGAVALAFGRVFVGQPASARLLVAALAAVWLAALMERRPLAASLGVSLLGLATAVALAVFPDTTFYGVPTRATIVALLEALGRVSVEATEQTAPSPALPSLFSAALIAVWAAAYSTHALAARAGSAILALAPPAALLGFAGVVMEDGARPVYAGIFLVGAIGVLFAARMRDVAGWGPILPRRVRGLRAGEPGRVARRVGLAATATAVLIPAILPGFGAGALLDVGGSTGQRISISPLVDIRPNLLRRTPIELFTVRADRPAYWHLLSLDRYDGRFWTSTDVRAERGTPIDGSSTLTSGTGRIQGRFLSQEFRLSRLGGVHLPAANTPIGISAGIPLRHDPDRVTIVAQDGIPDGLRYTVNSETLAPAPEELDRDMDFSGVDPRYLELPPDTPPEVFAFATEITGGAGSAYRKALAIQNLLRQFDYDERAPAGHGIDDLLFFLQTRRGYCEQFAGTMSVLLRALGYPARVAVGFTSGDRQADGLFHVTTEQAHSWVEMFFPGIGWLPFEPTPSRNNPVATPYLSAPAIDRPDGPARGELAELQDGGLVRGALADRLAAVERRFGGGGTAAPLDDAPAGEGFTVARALPAAAALAALVLALIPAGKLLRRRRRLRVATTPRARILTAFEILEGQAAEIGIARRPEETLLEYRARLRGAGLGSADLDALLSLADRAIYAPREPGDPDAERAVASARSVVRTLRGSAGRLRTVLGAVRPVPQPGY